MKEEKENTNFRPPIVAVLGHVDHGKTTLLDKIRNTNVTSKEAGGITQSIGAWQVTTKDEKKITFIDTPGHEAFSTLRLRGAKIADIVLLVVAADDGVMPQTRESIQYINETGTPFIVVITKIDLPAAGVANVKKQLSEEGVACEGWGGDVVCIEVSGKTGKGIDELLEMIILVASMNEVSGNRTLKLSPEVVVVEQTMEASRGLVVRGIVRDGILRVGDVLFEEAEIGKVRGIFDEKGKPVREAGPGEAVEIIGFGNAPSVGAVIRGDKVGLFDSLALAQGKQVDKVDQIEKNRGNKMNEEGLPIIIKADTVGSLEAVDKALGDSVYIFQQSVGRLTDGDVFLARTSGAVIVGFNVKATRDVLRLAEEEGVRIYTYKIIYELIRDVSKWVKEKKEVGQEKILGKASVVAEFPHGKNRIAGCRVEEGRILKNDKLRLVRGGEVAGSIWAKSLKRGKVEVDKVGVGEEFGIFFEPQFDFEQGDVIESLAR